MDLSLHEIVSQDVFGGGFSIGAENRLSAAVKRNIPMVLAPGGLDFVDFAVSVFDSGIIGDPEKRKFTLHNEGIAHIKLFPEEAKRAAEIVVDRLKNYSGEAVMILPLKGLRADTRPGEKLFAPEVDEMIFNTFREKLNNRIRLIELDAHISEPIFSKTAAQEMINLLRK